MSKLKTPFCIWSLVLFLIVTFANCGSDDGPGEPTAQELAFELLSGSWSLANGGSVTLDGENITANFTGFQVSFTDGTYGTSDAGDLFKANGTWQWVADSASEILLDDGKAISISMLSETDLVFRFQFAGTGGVVAGLAGSYVVTLKK